MTPWVGVGSFPGGDDLNAKSFRFLRADLAPLVAMGWGVYLGSKWIASQLVTAPLDQTVMAVLALAVVSGALGSGIRASGYLPDWL